MKTEDRTRRSGRSRQGGVTILDAPAPFCGALLLWAFYLVLAAPATPTNWVAPTNMQTMWNEWQAATPEYTNAEDEVAPSRNPDLTRWTDRVIPLPKKTAVKGSITVPAGAIRFMPLSHAAPLTAAVSNLLEFAKGAELEAKVTIAAVLAKDVGQALAQRLAVLPNADQAYAIEAKQTGWIKRKVEIRLVANTPLGLLYAARTLNQLVKPPAQVTPDTQLEIPLVSILDWPDIAERGEWGEGGKVNLPVNMAWLAQWKLNLIESFPFASIDKNGNPVLATNDFGLSANNVRRAAELGIKAVPIIPHLEQAISAAISLARENPAFEKYRGCLMTPDPAKPVDTHKLALEGIRGLCMSSPATIDLLAAWLMQMAGRVNDHHPDIMVWLSESGGKCYCKDCAGKDQFELEVAGVAKAFARVRQKYPGMHLRLLTSQASFPSDDKIIAAIKDLGPNAGIGLRFYDAFKTYGTNRKPLIHPVLEAYAREGGWVGITPSITFNFSLVFPMTSPQFIRFRAQEFADKRLTSVAAFIVPSRYYYAFNTMAWAEWTWNAHGRSSFEFARAYATVTGIYDPELFARWAVKEGDASWTLASSVYSGGDPGFMKYGHFAATSFENMWKNKTLHAPAVYVAALANAREALDLAMQSGNTTMIRESGCTLSGLELFGLYRDIFNRVHAAAMTPADKQELAADLDRLDVVAQCLRTNLLDWGCEVETMSKAAGGGGNPARLSDRLLIVALGPMRAADILRAICGGPAYGITDPRPATRIADLGEWSRKDFAKGNAVLKFDITDKVDRTGGRYHVCFDSVACDYIAVITSVSVAALTTNAPARRGLSHVPFIQPLATDWGNYAECPLTIPPVASGERIMLEVAVQAGMNKMTEFPEKLPPDRTCNGLVGWRKIE